MSPKASTHLLVATQSDQRLAALVRAGHDRAFEALVLRHRPALLRYCRRLSLSDTRAEDVVQQALLQAWTALRRGAEVRDLRAWLYRIVHNTAVNVVRDAARDGQLTTSESSGVAGAPLGSSATAAATEPDLGGGLAAREALGGIAALPRMQREVILRTAVAGHSHEEVASALGLSDGAVRGLLYRARASLRSTITALTPPPLLTWMLGSGQGAGAERIGELAAGGGGIGLGGLAFKGLAAITAGTLLTGAVLVHAPKPVRHRAPRRHSSAVGDETLAAIGGSLGAGRLSLSGASGAAAGASAPPVSHRLGDPTGRSPRHRSASYIAYSGGRVSGGGAGSPLGSTGSSPGTGSPTENTTTVHLPVSSGGGSPGSGGGASPGGSAGGGGGGSQSSPGSSPGGSAGGGSGASGSSGGSSGGGSGTSGSSGGSSGGGSGTSGSSGGSSGGGSGTSGSGSESPPAPPSGGGGSGGSGSSGGGGPVGTVVHEVTNLVEGTVNGLLGGKKAG